MTPDNTPASVAVVQSFPIAFHYDIDPPRGAFDWIEEIAMAGEPPHRRIDTPSDSETILFWQNEKLAAVVLNVRDQMNQSVQLRIDLRDRLAFQQPGGEATGERTLGRVRNCRECPYRKYYSGGKYECYANFNGELGTERLLPEGHTPSAPIPDWCPLELAINAAPDAALWEAARNLLPFTSHTIGCAIYQRSWASGEPPCTCGLDDAREALAATPSQKQGEGLNG